MDLVPDKYNDDDPPPRQGRGRSPAGANGWFWAGVVFAVVVVVGLIAWGMSSGNGPGIAPTSLTTVHEPLPDTKPSTTVKEPADRVPTSRDQPPPSPSPQPPPPSNHSNRVTLLQTEQGANTVTLKWESPIGPGQVLVPVVAPPPEEDAPALPPITRLVAVTFTPDGRDLLFIGACEPGKPVLDPQELFDAFVVSLRALAAGSEPPGVSIDPTPEQAAGKIDEKSRMPVRYLGNDAGTTLGLVAFEGDLLLKWLGLGKNSLTGQPFSCAVPGYLSRVARLDKARKTPDPSWHRFWIAVKDSQVSPSADGRTFWVETRLFVDTRRMSVDARGELHDAKDSAEPTAQQFSDHISENYSKYADEFPVLARLQAFAQLTAVARAVLGEPDKKDGIARNTNVDLSWLLYGYQPRPVPTPLDTPATVALGAGFKLTGGVNLEPKNQYRKGEAKVEELQRTTLAERGKNPAAREWTAHAEGKELRVSARGPVVWGTPLLTQTDLRVGDLELVRDWSPTNPDSPLGRGWSLRLAPQVSVSRTLATLENGQKRPSSVTFQDRPDRVVIMRPAKLRLPGQPEVLGYLSADGKQELYPFKNDFLYLEGDIKWFEEQPSGRLTREMGPDARIVHFTPDEAAPRVQEIETSRGLLQVEHEDGLPVQFRDKAGNSIKLAYDQRPDGSKRLREARGSDGQVRQYRHDSHHHLVRVEDDHGRGISYHATPAPGRPLQVLVDVAPDARAETASLPQAEVRTLPTDLRAREAGARPGIDARIAVVDAKTMSDAELHVHADVVLQGADDGASAAKLRAAVAPEAGEVLVVRNPDVVQAMKEVMPDLTVIGTSNLERAAVKLKASLGRVGQGEVLVLDGANTLEPVKQALGKVASTADARVVIVAGHMDARSAVQLRGLIEAGKFKDRAVILATCGVEQTRALIDEMIEAGAVRVWFFDQTIPQKSLPTLVERIQQQLEIGKQLDWLQNLRRSFRYGIKDTFKKSSDCPMNGEQAKGPAVKGTGRLAQAA